VAWFEGTIPPFVRRDWEKRQKNSITIADRRGWDFKPGPAKYETGVLTTRPRRSVCFMVLLSSPKYNYPNVACLVETEEQAHWNETRRIEGRDKPESNKTAHQMGWRLYANWEDTRKALTELNQNEWLTVSPRLKTKRETWEDNKDYNKKKKERNLL
jgi:hypothetical protein